MNSLTIILASSAVLALPVGFWFIKTRLTQSSFRIAAMFGVRIDIDTRENR